MMFKGGIGGSLINYNTKVVLFTKNNCNKCNYFSKKLNINYDKYIDKFKLNNREYELPFIYINLHNINKEEEQIWNIKQYPTILIIRNDKIIYTLYNIEDVYKYLKKKKK